MCVSTKNLEKVRYPIQKKRKLAVSYNLLNDNISKYVEKSKNHEWMGKETLVLHNMTVF